ncbi:MAG TPA: gamma-glutamylcyclotransferase family protein [Polyangiaceae bacterium]|nr:gamma-glutamylcyclotransferase family protein [Polyangiaceae bacterium]
MTEAVPLFVYGSLMFGLKHHQQLVGARPLGEAELMDHHLVLYEGAYPALVPGVPAGADPGVAQRYAVVGEVFMVEHEHLLRLDQFEDCPDLYQRVEVTLCCGLRAQAYAITRKRAQAYPVIGGSFREFLRDIPAHSFT